MKHTASQAKLGEKQNYTCQIFTFALGELEMYQDGALLAQIMQPKMS